MEYWQQLSLSIFSLINFLVFSYGLYQCKYKKNAFGLTKLLFIFGIFAWGDAVIFAPFWIIVSLITLLLQDWYLFLLIISVFWLVRSLGEMIYWFNQQFSTITRNPPNKLPFYSLFKNDSIWYVHQIFWQCVLVVSIILTIYRSKLWFENSF